VNHGHACSVFSCMHVNHGHACSVFSCMHVNHGHACSVFSCVHLIHGLYVKITNCWHLRVMCHLLTTMRRWGEEWIASTIWYKCRWGESQPSLDSSTLHLIWQSKSFLTWRMAIQTAKQRMIGWRQRSMPDGRWIDLSNVECYKFTMLISLTGINVHNVNFTYRYPCKKVIRYLKKSKEQYEQWEQWEQLKTIDCLRNVGMK